MSGYSPPAASSLNSYAEQVRALKSQQPCLEKLDEYLFDSASSKQPCRLSSLDYFEGATVPTFQQLRAEALYDEIKKTKACCNRHVAPSPTSDARPSPQLPNKLLSRLFFVEDPTREIIGALGAELQIDPLFFASYIDTPKVSPGWLPPKLAIAPYGGQTHEHTTFYHQRAIEVHDYVPPAYHVQNLIRDGNVKRKIAILPAKQDATDAVGLLQHCTSVLRMYLDNGVWIGLVLVDRSAKTLELRMRNESKQFSAPVKKETSPFSSGFQGLLIPNNPIHSHESNQSSLYDAIVEYWRMQAPICFDACSPPLLALAVYPLYIIISEWLLYGEVLFRWKKEYKYSGCDSFEQLNADLRTLQSWQDRCDTTLRKIRSARRFLEAQRNIASSESARSIADRLLADLEEVAQIIERQADRLEKPLLMLPSLIQNVNTQRAFEETIYIRQLTVPVLLFGPLTFLSSLFSMSAGYEPGGPHQWVYWASAIPTVLLTFFVARPPAAMRFVRWGQIYWFRLLQMVANKIDRD